MENRYYTPDISEFHVGFEYESYNEYRNEWYQEKLSYEDYEQLGSFFYSFLESYENNYLRIKYLCKEDIEECAWNITKDREYEFDAQYSKNDFIFWDLTYDIEEKTLQIEEFYQSRLCEKSSYKKSPNLYNSKTIFDGTIKNKSELKKVMEMLNIK